MRKFKNPNAETQQNLIRACDFYITVIGFIALTLAGCLIYWVVTAIAKVF